MADKKHPDDADRNAKRNLPLDPGAGCEPMPPPGTVPVDLDTMAPTFAAAYGLAQLEADRNRSLVSLARLPPWPGAPAEGHGIGEALDRALGGGVCPEYLLAIGAARAGAGKTAWTMQVAEGLALRCAAVAKGEEDGPLTPVVVLSEMGIRALTWRSLARWTGADSRIFRAGKSDPAADDTNEHAPWVDAARAYAGPWGDSRRYLRLFSSSHGGVAMVAELAQAVATWCEQLRATTPDREVWPVVVMDPIQRWQDTGKSEVEALNELVEAVAAAAYRDGWIAFLTSDTNKASAVANAGKDKDDDKHGPGVFRGSYKLLHLADAALVLDAPKDPGLAGTTMEVHLVKNRWGTVRPQAGSPRYTWHPTTGRFEVAGLRPLDMSERRPRKRGK